jgi:hypothetical protein
VDFAQAALAQLAVVSKTSDQTLRWRVWFNEQRIRIPIGVGKGRWVSRLFAAAIAFAKSRLKPAARIKEKYGERESNKKLSEQVGLKRLFLHAASMQFALESGAKPY